MTYKCDLTENGVLDKLFRGMWCHGILRWYIHVRKSSGHQNWYWCHLYWVFDTHICIVMGLLLRTMLNTHTTFVDEYWRFLMCKGGNWFILTFFANTMQRYLLCVVWCLSFVSRALVPAWPYPPHQQRSISFVG